MYNFIPNFMLLSDEPPYLYNILESIASTYLKDKPSIYNLPQFTRQYIFNFYYPLSNKVNRAEFETLILNKFMQRRIGFPTMTAFKIALNVKLNEIMPMYNKMFDVLSDWNIFNDGEVETRTSSEQEDTSSSTSATTETSSSTSTSEDRRFSDTPENRISDVQDGNYITEYNYNTNTGSDSGSSSGTTTGEGSRDKSINETITRSPKDKIALYKEYQENIKSIYTMIFKDLDCLFYQLV
jgi:hypothetical protein